MARKPETPESHTRKPETRKKAESKKVNVRFLVPVSGTDVSYRADTVYEMDADEAAKWCDGVRAKEV